ncbi:hypothetical protein SAMN06272775_1986 [Streptomyces sp. 2323.1]|nr:hypothetical protein SAMN06272775_1986 [Streptomyces sp. 2323.1]
MSLSRRPPTRGVPCTDVRFTFWNGTSYCDARSDAHDYHGTNLGGARPCTVSYSS